ncbi:hypothetical protein [Staphylococcus agnetis]|uniref:hypothetical protein n=1 Tax=Staphylococcus agnetis TaxID=985762 RepID=UPI001430C313|nr:hypothetical protein [Staphylococcus agnetis]NJH98360.1 hypothetical protein [Staphylococcus agnetis]
MKKILFVLFASLLVLSACGNQDEKENKEKPSNSTVENKKENKEEKEEYSNDNIKGEISSEEQQYNTQEQQQTQQQTSQEQPLQQNQQKYDYDQNGVYRTPQEQQAHERWINDQVEWNKQREAREQKLQNEYFQLSDKMYEDGVSQAEYNSMEKRQEEILNEVTPIN